MSKLLHKMDVNATCVLDGSKMIEYCSQDREFDVMIVDALMPTMSGSEAMFALRQLDCACKNVEAFGFSAEEDSFDQSVFTKGLLTGHLRKNLAFKESNIRSLLLELGVKVVVQVTSDDSVMLQAKKFED